MMRGLKASGQRKRTQEKRKVDNVPLPRGDLNRMRDAIATLLSM